MRDKILEDLKNSMKNQDKEALAVIRMVKGSIQMEELNKKRLLTDDEVIDVISKQIKIRREAIVEFEKGNRQDLIDQNNKEIEILNKYMPAQMTEEEIISTINKVFNEVNPTSSRDMGKIMGLLTPLVKGKCDMTMVSKIIKDKLSEL